MRAVILSNLTSSRRPSRLITYIFVALCLGQRRSGAREPAD